MKKTYQDIFRIRPMALPVTLLSSLIQAVKPFIYIIFPAKILNLLLAGTALGELILLTGIAVTANGILLLLQSYLDNLAMEYSDFFGMYEKLQMTERLESASFQALDRAELRQRVAMHRGQTDMYGSFFRDCLLFVQDNSNAIFSVIMAIVGMDGVVTWLLKGDGTSMITSPWMGILIIATTVLVFALAIQIGTRSSKKAADRRKEYTKVNSTFEYYRDMVSDYRTGKEVRLYDEEPFILTQASGELLEEGPRIFRSIWRHTAFSSGLSAISFAILTFGFAIMVALKAKAGQISVGDMVIYVGAAQVLIDSIRKLSENIGNLTGQEEKAALYYGIMDDLAAEKVEGTKIPVSAPHSLEVRHLGYTYENGNFSLKDISLRIEPGEKVAIVGANGSGKTTFAELLGGLRKPEHGEILLDDVPIESYSAEEYHKQISYISQQYKVFSFTLGENVALSENYDMDLVKQMLKRVDFPEDISLETYLNKDCREDGRNLSGGEAQKVAQARAFMKNCGLIILDEPTSALDPYAEYRLYTEINELAGNNTAIFISHRLSACRFCDKVAVFGDGRLLQFGSHDELIRDTGGVYYQLFNAQAKYYRC